MCFAPFCRQADLLPLLRKEGWHESLLNLVADTPTSRLRIRDLFDRHPFVKTGGASEVSHRWPAGRITLLGNTNNKQQRCWLVEMYC